MAILQTGNSLCVRVRVRLGLVLGLALGLALGLGLGIAQGSFILEKKRIQLCLVAILHRLRSPKVKEYWLYLVVKSLRGQKSRKGEGWWLTYIFSA